MGLETVDVGYGAWIKPDGELVSVPGQCEHKNYIPYDDANKAGWIAVIYQKRDNHLQPWLCARWNKHTVTVAALRTLLKAFRASYSEAIICEDIYMQESYNRGSSDLSKSKNCAFLVQEIAKVKDRMENGRER